MFMVSINTRTVYFLCLRTQAKKTGLSKIIMEWFIGGRPTKTPNLKGNFVEAIFLFLSLLEEFSL